MMCETPQIRIFQWVRTLPKTPQIVSEKPVLGAVVAMNKDNLIFPRVRTFIGLARDMVWLALIFAPIFGLMLFGIFSWNRDLIREVVRSEFGIAALASAQSLQDVNDAVEVLSERVRRASGDNRIIRQTPGLSYVFEPVSVGENIILNLVIERTDHGEDCILRRGQSLFSDTSGVPIAGSAFQPTQQLTTSQARLRVDLVPPPKLKTGRIELYIALEYECGGNPVFERTDTVTYKLLEAKP